MVAKSVLYTLYILIALSPALIKCDLYCSLVWEPNGYGHYPIHSNPVRIGQEDLIVARVYLSEHWVLGMLIPSKGKIFTDDDGRIVSFNFYQVLTNPHNCQLHWIESSNGIVPANFVNAETPDQFIGRTIIEGYQVGGRIFNNQIRSPFRNRMVKKPVYEVLTSIYPKLNVLLNKITYLNMDFVEISVKTQKEFVQGQLIANTVNEAQLSTIVQHSRTTAEQLVLVEDVDFREIGNISTINIGLWFGTDDLVLDNYQVNGQSQIVLNRAKTVEITRNIVVNARDDVQVCSTINVLVDHPIEFESVGVFRLPGMTRAHVEHVLLTVGGRKIKEFGTDFVVATMKGKLAGRYVTSSTMQISALDKLGPCVSLMPEYNF